MAEERLPLEGIRVLEVGELIAGPFACTLLGEFGAEVIKVERPDKGDVVRLFGPAAEGDFFYWSTIGRNKKSVVLDLRQGAARSTLADLIQHSDVVVESLRPGTFDSWGFTDAVLQAAHPRLIIMHVSGFGRSGPYRMRPGYDPVAQAISGLSYMTGDPDGPPMRAGGSVPICDFTSGFLGALGVVLAILERVLSQQGQVIDIALYDLAFRVLAPLVSFYDRTGEVYARAGNRSLGGAPTGHFHTKDDKWLSISVQGDDQFERCVRVIGHEEWLSEGRFRTLDSRTANRQTIDQAMAEWVEMRTAQDASLALEAVGLVCGTIYSPADAARDAHLNVRSLVRVDGPGSSLVPRPVPMLSRTPGRMSSEAPRLGEQTSEVLTDLLGYTREQVQALRATGAVEALDSERLR